MKNGLITTLLILGLITSGAYASVMVDVLNANLWDADTAVLNANLGITSQYTIEDFEDKNLVSGLNLMVEDHDSGFDVFVPPSTDLIWDGQRTLVNVDENGFDGKNVTFTFDQGVLKFGIGISQLNNDLYPHIITVNNNVEISTDIFNDPDWDTPNPAGQLIRNGYIWITATQNDLINSIEFNTVKPSGDTIHFDHAAIFNNPALFLDIKPQSCPNPINVKSKGVLPVAILGTAEFDVLDIDPVSIRLAGIAAIRSSYEDVATPIEKDDECECTEEGADGFLDLTLKFDTQEIVAAIGAVNDGDEIVLNVTGELSDGTLIEGSDCVLIISKGKP